MNTLTSTFAVSDVKRATQPLRDNSYYDAVWGLLNHRQLFAEDDALMELVGEWEEFDSETRSHKTPAPRPIEACSRYHGRLLGNVLAHPVIVAVHRAFMEHRPLCLSPDMIWLLICQGVANHVNAHAEDLRSRFVAHQGKAKIVVQRDDFIKGSPENPWGEVVDDFSAQIRDHIGAAHDLFVPRFSTTGPTERIAAEIVLLDAMQSYFEYVVETLCGIPEITLEGTIEDWQSIADRAQSFSGFGLEWWLPKLQPILSEFVASAGGDVRREFWESIYKFQSMSGGATVSGWITTFFPYLKSRQSEEMRPNRWLIADHSGPSPGNFPSGLSRAPFVWEYIDKKFDMEFLGGFVGVAQDSETLTLRPEIGWAIRDVTSA